MAVNRYVEWAQQPVIERAPDYLQQNIPLPFQELMAVGQLRQKEYDDTAKNMSLLGNGLLNLEGLKEVVLSSGQRLPVADADRISQAQRDLIEFQNEMAGRDLGDPKNREIVRQKAAELAARVAPTGDLGRIDANAKAFKALRQEFQKQKDPEKRQGRFLDFDRQLYDYYAGASDKIVPTAFGEYTDINKNIQDGLKGMDPELDDIYAIQENPNDPLYIRVREGMRAGVYDDRIRSAFNSFWPQSDAKAALEGKIRDTIALAQYEGRPLTDNRGREVSPEEFYKASMEETRRNLEDYAVQLYKKSEGKENLSIQQKNEFIVGQEGNKIEEPGEVIPIQTIKGNAFDNPFMEGIPSELPIYKPGSLSSIWDAIRGAGDRGAGVVRGIEGQKTPGGSVTGGQIISDAQYQWNQIQSLGLDPKYAATLGPIILQSGFLGAKTDAQKAKVVKEVTEKWNSKRASLGVINDQIRVPSINLQKDLEYNLLGGRDDNNVGTLAVAIVDDPKFGKPMPFTDWLKVSGAKNLKDFKSKTKYIGKIRSATGEQSDAISYNGRIITVQAETMERKNQMFPTYNALSAVKYGKVNEIKNHDLSEAVGYPRGTAVVNIRGEDIWEGNKHVGRRLIIQDTKTGQAIGEEQLNDMMDGADVYMNSPGTRKTTRTGGTDVGLRKDIDIYDSGK